MRFRFLLFLGILCLATLLIPIGRSVGQQTGPLGVVNHFPPHMIFLTPLPRSAQTLDPKTVSVAAAIDYFSIYFSDESSTHRALIDMEALVTDLRLDYAFSDMLSAGVRIPLVSMGDGFMDIPLEQYHRSFGLPNYGKEERPYDQFAYTMEKNGQQWFRAQNGGLNLLDPTLSTQLELLQTGRKVPTTVGMIYDLKLPLGDRSAGLGSGNWDHGVYFPVQFNFPNLNVHLMPGYIRIGTPDLAETNISVRDIKSFFCGGEYLFKPNTSILAQINAYTSPFVNTGIDRLETLSVELALGIRWTIVEKMSLELSFNEDLTRTAPDFNLHFMVTRHFP